MSPQIILGEPYTIKCDVWSLAVVFYKMLYNLYPWKGTENIVVLTSSMKEKIDYPPHIQVSKWLKDLITEMMTVDESKRIGIKQALDVLLKNSKDMDLE